MDSPDIIRKYEGLFLIDNTHATKEWDAAVNHVHEMLQKHEAEILSSEKWGERKLAYKIKGQKRGTYLLILFNAPTGAVTNINQSSLLSEIILRCLIVRDLGLEVARSGEAEKAEEKSEVKEPPPIEEAEKAVEKSEVKEPPPVGEEKAPAEAELEETS